MEKGKSRRISRVHQDMKEKSLVFVPGIQASVGLRGTLTVSQGVSSVSEPWELQASLRPIPMAAMEPSPYPSMQVGL